jgi:hypothetical protein
LLEATPVDEVDDVVDIVEPAPASFEPAAEVTDPAGFADESVFGCAVATVARQARKPKEDSAATA